MLLAGTYVGNMTSPLPIAIAANLGSAGAVSVLAGSLISYLISNTMLDNLPLLFALVVVVCLRVMKRPAKTSAGIACSTGLCVFFSGIVVSLLFHASGVIRIIIGKSPVIKELYYILQRKSLESKLANS